MKKNKNSLICGVLALSVVVAGCSTGDIQSRGRLDYLQSSSVNPLELPPDLVASQNRTGSNRATQLLSEYQKEVNSRGNLSNRVLASSSDVRLERSGNQRWISTSLPADIVWTRSVQLFQELGLPIAVQNPEAGILESGWAENRADVPDSFIRQLLKKALDNMFSAPTRDKFKLRLERNGKNVLVYITHYGMKDKTTGSDDEFHTWVDRPRDPELEAEMLSRLMVKLGATSTQEYKQRSTIQFNQEGNRLVVNRPVESIWPQVGSLLDDGANFKVESQNSNSNSYVVLQKDPTKKTGSRLAFWKARQPVYYRFNVTVTPQGKGQTAITIQPLDSRPTADIINQLRINLL